MKYLLVLIFSLSLFSQKYASKHDDDCYYCDNDYNDIEFSFSGTELDDGELTIKKRGRYILAIKDDGRLYVNEKKVETTNEQRKMLKLYVDHFEFIIEESVEIGLEGAEIGLSAAGSAIAAVFSFDMDKMERKLEKMERKIEKKTEKLEERAEEIEYHAEEFAAIRCILKREIKELAYLDEF